MIAKMKKARVFVMKDDEEKLLKSLQRYGVLMITSDIKNAPQDTTYEEDLIARTNKIISDLKPYQPKKKPFKSKYQIVDYETFSQVDNQAIEFLDSVEAKLTEISKLKAYTQVLLKTNQDIKPWTGLDIKLSELENLVYAKVFFGFVKEDDLAAFDAYLEERKIDYEKFQMAPQGMAIAVASQEDLTNDLKASGMELVELPPLTRLVEDEVQANIALMETNETRIKELEAGLREDALRIDELKILSDQMLSAKELKKHTAYITDATVYFEGWVRADRIDLLTEAVKAVTDQYEIEIRDPYTQEVPPTQHKNNWFVEKFETITNMFAVPRYDEIDPNPMMSVWYWLFFGMMMGDWGYGLLMILIFGLIIKFKKPKGESRRLLMILFYSGFTTVLFGIIYGSVFGMNYDIGTLFGTKFQVFDLMNNPIPVLIAALIVGVVHIFVALILRAWKNIRQKDYLGIFSESLSWMLIIPGLAILIAKPKLTILGAVMAGVGALMIILFGGRHKKGILKKMFGGIGGLYGITGFVSDILSYSRILALALSSGVIAFSMNTIAGMLQASVVGFIFSILVYIIGHGFNLAMGLLSAYVHDSRLQYIEFFGKFYEGGGYLFKPFKLQHKHVDEIKDEALLRRKKV